MKQAKNLKAFLKLGTRVLKKLETVLDKLEVRTEEVHAGAADVDGRPRITILGRDGRPRRFILPVAPTPSVEDRHASDSTTGSGKRKVRLPVKKPRMVQQDLPLKEGDRTPPSAPPLADGEKPTTLRVLQDRLVGLIDSHFADLKDNIDEMGCKGNCYNCPCPEVPTVDEQVKTCLNGVVDQLSLDPSILTVPPVE